MKFEDISTENWREYTFPGGDVIHIDNPLGLNVSKSGGHRIKTDETQFYIPAGWICLAFDGEWRF